MGLAGNIRRLRAEQQLRDPSIKPTEEGYYELVLAATGDKDAAEKAMAKYALDLMRAKDGSG